MFYRIGCPTRSKTAGIPMIPFRGAGYTVYCTVIQTGDIVRLIDQLKKTSKTPLHDSTCMWKNYVTMYRLNR
jgi:hypothetical protein